MSELIKKALTDKNARDSKELQEAIVGKNAAAYAPWN